MSTMSHRPTSQPRLLIALSAILLCLGLVVTSSQAVGLTAGAEPAAAGSVHGLKGEYFLMSEPGARDFAELGGTVLDANLDLEGLTSTFERLTGRAEHTTARWTGELEAPEDGDYTFFITGDNGFRLYLDDELVIDHWEPDWDNEQTSEPVTLAAGERHDVRLEYFQDVGGAHIFMRWQSETIDKQIVPTTAFYPPADFEVFPADFTVAPDGLTLRAVFDAPVTGTDGLEAHLEVESDTIAMPVESASAAVDDERAVDITLGAPVQAGAVVRVYYDGEADLTVGGDAVPLIARNATNDSAHRLLTEWGESLDHDNPLPEYPRPQQVRERWQNLNGQWEFAGATEDEEPQFGTPLPEQITVPFPVESQLSGLERHEDHMFYRTEVAVPEDWRIGAGERLVLHFGAVDHEARVWVNGELVTEHSGGFTAFDVDITDALTGADEQEIIVGVTDTTGTNQPLGKQSRDPGGIVYTSSSGIWQTVWLEPVPDAHIEDITFTPDVDAGVLRVTVDAAGASGDAVVEVVARDDDGEVGRASGVPGEELVVPVPDARLWSPADPHLYDLQLTLTDGSSSDDVASYFGMRSVEVTDVGGVPKLVLNGEPVFSLAMLDQGYWPDGLMTAPSDEALEFDLVAQQELGFNAVRKHIKTEPDRWYYHADRLGLLVWQDFVNVTVTDESGQQAFLTEGERMMDQLHNSPSVIGWVVFNEGWGEWEREATGRIAEDVMARDPSRVINAHSGVNCCDSKGDSGAGHIIDHHDYTNTEPPFPDESRAAMDGEHGGFTLPTPGHLWPGAPAAIYSGVDDKDALTARYVDNTRRYYLDRARSDLSGSVYTQVTDLENEVNGLWTYDRKVLKVDPGPVRAINEQVIAAGAAAGAEPPGEAHWPLDEGEGTVAQDSSELGTDLVLADGTTWVEGVRGSALGFDGDGQFAGTGGPVVDTSGSYTVAAWVTLDELPGNYATAVSQDGSAAENPFYLQYGQEAFAFSTPGGQRARLEITPELDRWYHLVGVHDAERGEVSLYVDGAHAATAPAADPVRSAGELTVGRGAFNQQPGDWWSGRIDEVHVLPFAADADDVAGLYDLPEEPTEEPTDEPTTEPTEEPTTQEPTPGPTDEPSDGGTGGPTGEPSSTPGAGSSPGGGVQGGLPSTGAGVTGVLVLALGAALGGLALRRRNRA